MCQMWRTNCDGQCNFNLYQAMFHNICHLVWELFCYQTDKSIISTLAESTKPYIALYSSCPKVTRSWDVTESFLRPFYKPAYSLSPRNEKCLLPLSEMNTKRSNAGTCVAILANVCVCAILKLLFCPDLFIYLCNVPIHYIVLLLDNSRWPLLCFMLVCVPLNSLGQFISNMPCSLFTTSLSRSWTIMYLQS